MIDIKKNRFLIIFIILIIYIFLHTDASSISNSEFVQKLLYSSNYLSYESIDLSKYEMAFNPITQLEKIFSYENYKENNTYTVFNYLYNDSPRVYIYNTHQLEKYVTGESVIDAGHLLSDALNNLGINTILETRDVGAYRIINNLSSDYLATRSFLKEQLKENNFDLIIDLHRDSVSSKKITDITINDKDYARIMFVMNKNYTNYNYALKFNNLINKKYPNISRGIYNKYVDNFNQDLNDNVILIELGSNYNNFDQVKNTVDALAISIKEILDENEKKL